MNNDEIKFIDRLYKDLYLDETVINRGNKFDKFNNIKNYMQRLEQIHNKVSDTGKHEKLLKEMYYAKYIIKEEDIPESYYTHQQQIALERGYGYIAITEDIKRQYQKQIIDDQKSSLDVWIDYFLSKDSNVYPFWLKYWAFQGMLKLGNYDKKTGEFGNRTKNTVAPFADLNREALAISMDLIIKMLNKEKIDNKELEILIKSGSFGKIYSYAINDILKNNKNITNNNIGKWVKYDQGSNHILLVDSLKGYNTGWCTAGESTAKAQLSNGDFYVYYTLDENNEYKVPRIAIRMEYGKIAEIRGVAKEQNLEPEMEEVVDRKLEEFPDKEEYYKKVNDMKELTKIYKKHQRKEDLTKEDLTFLYEIYEEINGFGYEKDPRVEEIKKERNKRQDVAFIFDCKEEQIAFSKKELRNDTVYYSGDLFLIRLTSAKGLKLPRIIKGHLDLCRLTSAKGLKLPETIIGCLDLSSLTSAEGLKLPQIITENLNLSGLTSAEGLELPQTIGGYLDLSGLTSAEGLELPQTIGGYLDLSSLTSAEGLIMPDPLTYIINMASFKITPENVDEYRNHHKK